MKKFSAETIAEVNLISPDSLESHGIIQRAKGGGYICPFCGNGTGSDGTGMTYNKKDSSHVGWGCKKCPTVGYKEGHNNVQILAIHYGLDEKRDFREVIARACEKFGITPTFDDGTVAKSNYNRRAAKRPNCQMIDNPPPTKTEPTPQELKELEFIHADLNTADDSIFRWLNNSYDGHKFRGLPDNFLAKKFGCRYIADWVHPKSRVEGKSFSPTKRIIIPNGADSYLARLVNSKYSYPENQQQYIKDKQHAGTKTLFNADALTAAVDSDSFCFVTEGYFDAMSVDFAGFHCVALGGANEGNLLIKFLRNLSRRPKIILLLDADETGRKAADNLNDALRKIGTVSVEKFLAEGDSKLDANDILIEQGVDYLRGILNKIQAEAVPELNRIEHEHSAELLAAAEFAVFELNRDFYFSGEAVDRDWACRLEKFCGNKIRWLTDSERWLTFLFNDDGGGLWKRRSDKNSVITPFADKLSSLMHASAKTDKEKLLTDSFDAIRKVNSAVTYLKARDSILITADDLDTHKNLLNCLNGVVDLETSKLYDADPKYLITQQCKAVYNPNVDTAFIEKFLRDIMPNDDDRAALLSWCGYIFTGETKEQCALFTAGGGSNGKSTFLDLLLYLLGDYATALPVKAITIGRESDANATTTQLNVLEGVRLAVVDEFKSSHKLDEQIFKHLTGDRFLKIRRLHEEFTSIELFAKLLLNGNERPRLENIKSSALRRRIRALDFKQTFSEELGNIDKDLPTKLILPENLSAMLAIGVRAAQMWYQNGLLESTGMSTAKNNYLAENDFIEEFISERCIFKDGARIPKQEFEFQLREYLSAEGRSIPRPKELTKLITAAIENHGGSYQRTNKGFCYCGVGLLINDDFKGTPVSKDDTPF